VKRYELEWIAGTSSKGKGRKKKKKDDDNLTTRQECSALRRQDGSVRIDRTNNTILELIACLSSRRRDNCHAGIEDGVPMATERALSFASSLSSRTRYADIACRASFQLVLGASGLISLADHTEYDQESGVERWRTRDEDRMVET
jgi:hypothetical protein